MRNIIKTMLLTAALMLTFALTPKSHALPPATNGVAIWQSYYSRTEFIQEPAVVGLYVWEFTKAHNHIAWERYIHQKWWTVITTPFHETSYSPFAINYSDYAWIYETEDTTWDFRKESKWKVKNDSPYDKLITFQISAQQLDGQGNWIGTYNATSWRVIYANSTWEGKPFLDVNFQNATLTWTIQYNPL
jgi:hypothetical protein